MIKRKMTSAFAVAAMMVWLQRLLLIHFPMFRPIAGHTKQ